MDYAPIVIRNAHAYEGQKVCISGWVHQKRSSGKIKFMMVRDGSERMQAVFMKDQADEKSMLDFEACTQETSLKLYGIITKDTRSELGYELQVHHLTIVHLADPYPISPKEHGIEFLMEHRHLWLRSNRPWACMQIRNTIIQAIHGFFQQRGFIQLDSPILTPNSCEGTSTLFQTNYFDTQAYLTQSGQLYGEACAMAFGKIYTFGPTFRAEKSKTRKHLTEFWMIEPEVAFANLEDIMQLAEQFIHHIIRTTCEKNTKELKALGVSPDALLHYCTPFARLHYDEAIALLQEKGFNVSFGDDLGAPHEAAIGEMFHKPVFIYHMPADIKAFYFKRTEDKRYALACDLIAPEGYGEIIGGGCREEDYHALQQRLKEHHLDLKDYQWYLDLRKYGSVPHGGFGLGLERMVAWITGADHVRESIPFPRLMHHLHP